jgi:glycosyltransferase involved in cell wall biosynthesis
MMPKEQLSISVLAANYNNGRYLDDFIRSIIDSSVYPCELIIVDDGSQDDSRSILEKYAGLAFAHFIFLPANVGFANALNAGLEVATGDFIMRADPDDILHPEKMKLQYDYLRQHPHIEGTGCNVSYFRKAITNIRAVSNFPVGEKNIRDAYQRGEHGIQHPTLMMRAEVYKSYRYRQEYVPAEDYDIIARMVNDGHTFENLGRPLYYMRIHAKSASSGLEFKTINTTFGLRQDIFGHKTSWLSRYLYYLHMRNYRNFLLLSRGPAFISLMAAVLLRPSKLWKRCFTRASATDNSPINTTGT